MLMLSSADFFQKFFFSKETFRNIHDPLITLIRVLFYLSLAVKAAPHECVIWTGQS